MTKLKSQRRSGFTLLEMAIVLFIISLLILIVIPNLSKQRKNATGIHSKAMVNVIQTQADLFQNEQGRNPASLNELYKNQYLTTSQLQSAKKNHIVIVKGNVRQE